MPCQSEGNRAGAHGRFCASVSLCKGAPQGRGDPWLLFLLLFQLSAVEAGGSTAFIYANFSVPVVKVRGTCGNTGSREGRTLLSVSQLLQGVVVKPLLMPNPSPGAPSSVLGCQKSVLGIPALF